MFSYKKYTKRWTYFDILDKWRLNKPFIVGPELLLSKSLMIIQGISCIFISDVMGKFQEDHQILQHSNR